MPAFITYLSSVITNSAAWTFFGFVLALILAVRTLIHSKKPNPSLKERIYANFLRTTIFLLILGLLIVVTPFLGLKVIVQSAKGLSTQTTAKATNTAIQLITPTPTPTPQVKVKPTATPTPQTSSTDGGGSQSSGGNTKSNPTPTPRPKPTPTPTPADVYPHTITENITTACDDNAPNYIAGEIDSVEIVSTTEVIYYITFFNNSDENLGLNTYTMNLGNESTGTASQASQPAVPINAHDHTNETYEFDNISITSNTTYTLSWDISEGNVFTCTFPNESLRY